MPALLIDQSGLHRQLRLRGATLRELIPVRPKHLLGAVELANQIIRPLARERRPQFGLLPSLHQVAERGHGAADPRLERGEFLVRGQFGVGEGTLPVERFDLELLRLLKESADPDQLLPKLRFLWALPLDRFGRGGQRSRGLGRGRPRLVNPGENRLTLSGERCSGDGDALYLLGGGQRGLTFALQCLLRVSDPGLDLEHRIRCLAASE